MIRKKDPWVEFLLARKRIWCHADTKTRHAAQKYYAVVVATNQTTTMSATGLGCSPWALVWFHGLCACLPVRTCLCTDVWCVWANSVAEVIWGLRLAIHLTHADLTHVIGVEDGRVTARCANTERKSERRDLCVCSGFSCALLDLLVGKLGRVLMFGQNWYSFKCNSGHLRCCSCRVKEAEESCSGILMNYCTQWKDFVYRGVSWWYSLPEHKRKIWKMLKIVYGWCFFLM